MSIIRTEHNKDNPYVILKKTALEDKNLSWAAKGLWAYLMSRPDDWTISIPHLSKIYEEYGGGETAIYNFLNELIKNGYCSRKQDKGEKGQFGKYEYVITEFKIISPQPGSPDAVPPDAVNPPLTNKGNILSKEQQQPCVVVSSEKEKKKQILFQRMKSLGLSDHTIEKAFHQSDQDIENAIECCLSATKPPENIEAYFFSALYQKWQPKPNKEKIEKLEEESKEKEKQLQQKLYAEVSQLVISVKGKLRAGFDVKLSGISLQFLENGRWATDSINENSMKYLKKYIEKNRNRA